MLIAEIGWNFLGDLDLAFKMIRSAKKIMVSSANFDFEFSAFLTADPTSMYIVILWQSFKGRT